MNIFSLPTTYAKPGPNILIVKLVYIFFIPPMKTAELHITVLCVALLDILADGH